MSDAPTPEQVYARAQEEGARRLDMPLLEQVATGFIAGITIVFGILALGIVDSLVATDLGSGVAKLLGAAAFGLGVAFLVVGRTELFTENFFGPVATAIDRGGSWGRLAGLWSSVLVCNVLGGAVLVALVTVDGTLPEGTDGALVGLAEEIAGRGATVTLARAVLAGALITLLSYMLAACAGTAARILVALLVGFFLALGPFDHVVVSALHLLFGIWESSRVQWVDLARNLALCTVGNLAGGLLLVTLTHTAQVKAVRRP